MSKNKKQSPESEIKVSPDIVYQEMYQELRRFRDYELTVSTWYTTILLAIAGAVFTLKYATPDSAISLLLASSCSLKIVISLMTSVIAFSGIYSVLYVRARHSQLRNYVSKNLEPSWKDFIPDQTKLKPHHLILANQIILVVLIAFAIWAH